MQTIEPDDVKRSMVGALNGEVPRALRGAGFNIIGRSVFIVYVVEGELDESVKETLQIAATEVAADLENDTMLNEEFIRCDSPHSFAHIECQHWAFRRTECKDDPNV